MSPVTRQGRWIAVALFANCITPGFQARGDVALTVPGGNDLFTTPADGNTWADVALPAGFFGSKGTTPSDAFSGRVTFQGVPSVLPGLSSVVVNSVGGDGAAGAAHEPVDAQATAAGFANADTSVFRGATTLPNIGDSATVPLQIQFLSLGSIQPIEVTYGGASPSFYDVGVELDPSSTQMMGSMTLTRTGATFGTFTSMLPVTSQLTFTGTSPTDPPPFEAVVHTDIFTAQGTFAVVPEPAASHLAMTGLAVGGLVLRIRNRNGKGCRRRMATAPL
jgi:hypothetical protein